MENVVKKNIVFSVFHMKIMLMGFPGLPQVRLQSCERFLANWMWMEEMYTASTSGLGWIPHV